MQLTHLIYSSVNIANMEPIIKKFITVAENGETLLTQEQALQAFDLFSQGKSTFEVKCTMFLPEDKLILLYDRLVEMRLMLERLVKGEAHLTYGETNPETGEVTEDTFVPSPTNMTELIQAGLQLINRDYDISEPLFQSDSISELIAGIQLVLMQIVQKSNSTNDATFDWWKSQILA